MGRLPHSYCLLKLVSGKFGLGRYAPGRAGDMKQALADGKRVGTEIHFNIWHVSGIAEQDPLQIRVCE